MKKHLVLLVLSIPSLASAGAVNWLLYTTGFIHYASQERCTALLVQALESKNISVASYLINKCKAEIPAGWNEDQNDRKMDDLLEAAIRSDDWQITEIALNAGASPFRSTTTSETPLLGLALRVAKDPLILWNLTGKGNPCRHDKKELNDYLKSHDLEINESDYSIKVRNIKKVDLNYH